MIAHDVVSGLRPAIPLLAVAGFALGVVYFASLRRGVHLAIVRQAWLPCMAWGFVRIAAATLLFTFAARCGLPALLPAFAGFLAARTLALRGARRGLA
jgi:hypothetical protein